MGGKAIIAALAIAWAGLALAQAVFTPPQGDFSVAFPKPPETHADANAGTDPSSGDRSYVDDEGDHAFVVAISQFRPGVVPAAMAGWEKALAHIAHFVFYLLMLGLPLSGWALASMGKRPIPFWGLFDVPHLPVAGLINPAQGRAVHHAVETFHGSILVWGGIALVVLHVAGALKHQFDRTPILWRMVPFLRPPAG